MKAFCTSLLFLVLVFTGNGWATEKDKFFSSFPQSFKTDRVAYLDKEEALVLYANPGIIDTIIWTFNALGVSIIGVAGVAATVWLIKEEYTKPEDGIIHYPSEYIKPYSLASIPGLIGAGVFAWSISVWRYVLNNIKMKSGFVPYLTFDAKGIKKFDTYVLEWKAVAGFRAITSGTHYRTECDGEYIRHISVGYLRCGSFEVTAEDTLLPIPYWHIEQICRHCVAAYGKEIIDPIDYLTKNKK